MPSLAAIPLRNRKRFAIRTEQSHLRQMGMIGAGVNWTTYLFPFCRLGNLSLAICTGDFPHSAHISQRSCVRIV